MSEFEKELESLINQHSRENGSDTPDFILAQYLVGCLSAWDAAVQRREKWYGRESTTLTAKIADAMAIHGGDASLSPETDCE